MHLLTLGVKRPLLVGVAILLSSSSCLVSAAYAAGGASVTIQSVYPTGGINPGQQVSFYAPVAGFANPSYALSDSFSGTSISGGDINANGFFSWTPVAADAGLHTLTVTVTDSYSHSATATLNILVLSNIVLVQSLSPGATIATGRTATLTAVAPGFTNPSFTVTDNYAGTTVTGADMVSSTGIFTWTPVANEQGPHVLTVGASDSYGHAATVKQTITVIAPGVRIGSLSPGVTVPAGTAAAFSASASNLASPTFSVADTFSGTTTVAASDMSASSGAFSWTPAASDIGLHTIIVTASDALGNAASTTQTLVVTAASSAPPQSSPSSPATTSTGAAPAAVTIPAAMQSDGYVFKMTLGIASRGMAVTELQKRLAALGFYTGPVTGYFGPLTSGAVKSFQKAHGLPLVGFVGPLTRAALNH